MTIDFTPELLTEASRSEAANRRAVSRWLAFTALMIFALVIVGGMTRLTDSGLSITEWKPIHGIIPPLSEAQWQEEFEKYKQIPEYAQINSDMELSGFKRIFCTDSWANTGPAPQTPSADTNNITQRLIVELRERTPIPARRLAN